MPDSLIMISWAMWDKAMMRLAMLEAKVWNKEGGVKAWVEIKLENQDRQAQGRLHAFEQWITHQLGNGQTPNIT